MASLGLGLYVVFERIFGGVAGVAVGAGSAALAGFFWFGLARADREARERNP